MESKIKLIHKHGYPEKSYAFIGGDYAIDFFKSMFINAHKRDIDIIPEILGK